MLKGLDGGTLVTRNDVLRRQSALVNEQDGSRSTRGGAVSGVYRKRKLANSDERRVRWSTCALSGERLAHPIVADYLGTLYNRQAVLQFLLGRQGSFAEESQMHRYINQLRELGTQLEHLTSMRDVFPVSLEPEDSSVPEAAPHRCPVTHLPCLTGSFSALVSCGHIFSERALKQLRGDDGGMSCPLCATHAATAEVVPILGSHEQVEALREALSSRRKRRKKNAAKACQVKAAAPGGSGNSNQMPVRHEDDGGHADSSTIGQHTVVSGSAEKEFDRV